MGALRDINVLNNSDCLNVNGPDSFRGTYVRGLVTQLAIQLAQGSIIDGSVIGGADDPDQALGSRTIVTVIHVGRHIRLPN